MHLHRLNRWMNSASAGLKRSRMTLCHQCLHVNRWRARTPALLITWRRERRETTAHSTYLSSRPRRKYHSTRAAFVVNRHTTRCGFAALSTCSRPGELSFRLPPHRHVGCQPAPSRGSGSSAPAHCPAPDQNQRRRRSLATPALWSLGVRVTRRNHVHFRRCRRG